MSAAGTSNTFVTQGPSCPQMKEEDTESNVNTESQQDVELSAPSGTGDGQAEDEADRSTSNANRRQIMEEAMKILVEQCGLTAQQAESGLHETKESGQDAVLWAEAALMYLATMQEAEDEAARLRDAMAASLEEKCDADQEQQKPLEEKTDEELLELFQQSKMLSKAQDLHCHGVLLKEPFRIHFISLLNLEKQSMKWYPRARSGICEYFQQMASEWHAHHSSAACLTDAAAPSSTTSAGEASGRSVSHADADDGPPSSDATKDGKGSHEAPRQATDSNAKDGEDGREAPRQATDYKRKRKSRQNEDDDSGVPKRARGSPGEHTADDVLAGGEEGERPPSAPHRTASSAQPSSALHCPPSVPRLTEAAAAADFLCQKAEELKIMLYSMPSTAGEVPEIFRVASAASSSSIEILGEKRGEVVESAQPQEPDDVIVLD